MHYFILYLAWMAPLAAGIISAAIQTRIPLEELTRDPLVVAAESEACCRFYYGAISNLGVAFWFFTAGAAFLCSLAHHLRKDYSARNFFAAGALITVILGFDDFYLIHENSINFFRYGEEVIFMGYAASLGLYLYYYRSRFLDRFAAPLFVAMAAFAFSVFADVFFTVSGNFRFFLEDGVKFLGVASWLYYFTAASARSLAGRQ